MPQVTFNGTKINVEFTESSSRQQLNSGENISTLFGKIKKIFSDLKAVCFSGSYNDLSNKPSSLPANGGNADTVDGFHADDFAKAYNDYLGTYLAGKSGDIRGLAHLLPTGGLLANTHYPEFQNITFPISGDILITWNKSKFSRNGFIYGTLTIQSMTSTDDIYICSVYNTAAYTDWQKIYTDWNKPYVTGSVTVAANATTAITNHNFMPSAALYLGIVDNVRFAPSFTTTSINLADVQTTERTIEYIIFK